MEVNHQKLKTLYPLLAISLLFTPALLKLQTQTITIGKNFESIALTNTNNYIALSYKMGIVLPTSSNHTEETKYKNNIQCFPNTDACLVSDIYGKIDAFIPQNLQNFKILGKYNHGNETGYLKQFENLKNGKEISESFVSNLFWVLSPIMDTSYFLAISSMEFGFIRWNLHNTRKYAAYFDFGLKSSDRLFDIEFIWKTPFVAYSIKNYEKLFLLDFTKMEQVMNKETIYKYKELNLIYRIRVQYLAYLSYKPSKTILANCDSKNCYIFNFGSGNFLSQKIVRYEPEINGVESLKYSKYLAIGIISSGSVEIYKVEENGNFEKIKLFNAGIGHKFQFINLMESSFVFSSRSKIKTLYYEPSSKNENCHQFCSTCERSFGNSHCSACTAIAKEIKTGCFADNFGEPFGGSVEFKNIKWSKENFRAGSVLHLWLVFLGGLVLVTGFIGYFILYRRESENKEQGTQSVGGEKLEENDLNSSKRGLDLGDDGIKGG